MTQRILEYFIAQAEDDGAKEIMQDTYMQYMQVVNYIEDIKTILQSEGAAYAAFNHVL